MRRPEPGSSRATGTSRRGSVGPESLTAALARRLKLVLVVAACAMAGSAFAQGARPSPAPAPAAKPKAQARAVAPPPGLGSHASLLEGTWEFRSLTRGGGVSLVPPDASGVIVIDRGVVLAASYLQASADRKVGNVWEGRMILGEDSFEVVPERGYRYDSAAAEPVVPLVPPRTKGSLEKLPDGALLMTRADGGSVTFEPGGRRVQRDADGTTIVHERTSLVPRVPDDLPGRPK